MFCSRLAEEDALLELLLAIRAPAAVNDAPGPHTVPARKAPGRRAKWRHAQVKLLALLCTCPARIAVGPAGSMDDQKMRPGPIRPCLGKTVQKVSHSWVKKK